MKQCMLIKQLLEYRKTRRTSLTLSDVGKIIDVNFSTLCLMTQIFVCARSCVLKILGSLYGIFWERHFFLLNLPLFKSINTIYITSCDSYKLFSSFTFLLYKKHSDTLPCLDICFLTCWLMSSAIIAGKGLSSRLHVGIPRGTCCWRRTAPSVSSDTPLRWRSAGPRRWWHGRQRRTRQRGTEGPQKPCLEEQVS